jgi:hypothetical protein
MPNGPEVTAFLATELKPNDVVLSTFPSKHVLHYHLRQMGQDNVMVPAGHAAHRALIVVNDWRYDLEEFAAHSDESRVQRVIEQSHFSDSVAGPPVLLYDHAPVHIFAAPLRSHDERPR